MLTWSSGRILALDARGSVFETRLGRKKFHRIFIYSDVALGWFQTKFVDFESNVSRMRRMLVGCVENVLRSRGWFRSTDLWVMGPARFLCATLLRASSGNFQFCFHSDEQQCSKKCYTNFLHQFGIISPLNCRAFVAQWLEHWSCKPGVESSNLSEGFCPSLNFNSVGSPKSKGSTGIRTRGLSHPKRESYH